MVDFRRLRTPVKKSLSSVKVAMKQRTMVITMIGIAKRRAVRTVSTWSSRVLSGR